MLKFLRKTKKKNALPPSTSIKAVSPPPDFSETLNNDESSMSVDRMKVYEQFIKSTERTQNNG